MTRLVVGDRAQARIFELPGRSWSLLIGPQNSPAANLTVAIASFPPGSAPPLHVHPEEEEVVFVLAGEGEIVTPFERHPLRPGTVFWVPPGLEHGAVCTGEVSLDLLCSFSPPVVPASYDP